MKPSLLTADPHTTWACSVTEDGQVILGSTHPRQAIGEQQLTDLVTGMRQKDEDLAAMTPDQDVGDSVTIGRFESPQDRRDRPEAGPDFPAELAHLRPMVQGFRVVAGLRGRSS